MGNTYDIKINDAVGRLQLAPRDWQILDYVRAENDVGALTLTLPGAYPKNAFKKDGLIEVWRSVEGAPPYLDTETLWMIRRRRWQYKARGTPIWTIYAEDLNSLLRRRSVDYEPDNAYTDKVAAADDMGKAIIRENMGTLATDTTRSIATWLGVDADQALAPIVRKAFARQNVLKVLQDLALWSYQQGTYLVFDVVCDRLPGDSAGVHFQFRSYVGQRGNDHRWPGGKPPLLIGAQYNNLDSVDDDDDATDEITRGIAIGPTVTGSTQAVARQTDDARAAESPFNLIEGTRNAGSSAEALVLEGEAQAELQSGIPREWLTGSLQNTSGLLYGVDWNWGDLLTAQANSRSADVHASRVHVHVERDQGDQVESILKGDIS